MASLRNILCGSFAAAMLTTQLQAAELHGFCQPATAVDGDVQMSHTTMHRTGDISISFTDSDGVQTGYISVDHITNQPIMDKFAEIQGLRAELENSGVTNLAVSYVGDSTLALGTRDGSILLYDPQSDDTRFSDADVAKIEQIMQGMQDLLRGATELCATDSLTTIPVTVLNPQPIKPPRDRKSGQQI